MTAPGQFHHRDVLGQGFLGQLGGFYVADVGAQGRYDAGAHFQQVLAVFPVGGDPFHTVDPQGVRRFPEHVDALEQGIEDHRFKGVQFQLSRLHGHGDAGVVAHHPEGHLAHHFRDHRVHFPGHNGRSVLLGRQVDLFQSGPGTGRHEPQVIGNLGQGNGTVLQAAGYGGETVDVLGGIDQVRGLGKRKAGQPGKIFGNMAGVGRGCIDSGTDGGTAHIDFGHFSGCRLDPSEPSVQGGGIGFEFLAQADGHCILELGPAHFQDWVEFHSFLGKGLFQGFQAFVQVFQQEKGGQFPGGGDHVIGGLAPVHIIVGMDQGVISLFPA